MLIADIGNRFAHLYNGKEVLDLKIVDLIKDYSLKKLCYINVNPKNKEFLKNSKNWIDLSNFIKIDGSYETMGIDRKALLLSRGDGIYIDAGSAITIDKKINGKFLGGVILPGMWIVKKSYKEISKALDIDKINRVNLESLPKSNTKDTISYGIIAPIVCLINSINKENLPIYCTGGDGELIASYLENAIYKKDLIFEGLVKVVKENNLC